jgi:DNA processing protein
MEKAEQVSGERELTEQMQLDLESWQRLSAVPGIGPVLFRQLVKRFGSPAKVLRASRVELCSLPNIDEKRAQAILEAAGLPLKEGWSTRLRQLGVTLLTYRDSNYPRRLLTTHDYPPLLYIKGQLTAADELAVAVVGSRRASSYGRHVAEKLAADLAHHGITVVSGLARGIDSMAHRGALAAGGRTLAVLGSGIDVIYPPEHHTLGEQIVRCGALISEFPLGSQPDAGHFPRRNRIISGLSLGVVVVEAGLRSGALLTARFALDQGREVFAVPGSIEAPGSQGPHYLIQEGAKLVQKVEDILEELPVPGRVVDVKSHAQPVTDLSDEEGKLLALVTDQPVPVDNLIAQSGCQAAEILSLLLSLEMKGLVQQLSGKRFVRR